MKNRFRIWFNFVIICLCACVIVYGVYAANVAKLTVSGSLGFEAHGVEMTIEGSLSGFVSKDNVDTATDTETKTLETVNLTKTASQGEMDLGEIYFTDLLGDVEDIVLTLTLKNTSPFKVTATVAAKTAITHADMTVTQDKDSVDIDATNGEATVIITFTLNNTEETITSLNLANVTTPIITFDRASA